MLLRHMMVGLALVAALSAPAGAETTWYVDDDAPNDPGPGDPGVSDPLEDGSAEHPFDAIQEGIDATSDGDTVLVADGTYAGAGNHDIDYGRRGITVRSENGAENCIIDCESAGRGVRISGRYSPSPPATLEGFSILNGVASSGGAVSCGLNVTATIANCRLVGNTAVYQGGAVYCYEGSDVLIIGCEIAGNSAAGGGGVYCYDTGRLTIIDCFIAENAATQGGGVQCQEPAHLSISACTLENNTSTQSGGGVYHSRGYAPASIVGCTIRGNTAGRAGGGIYIGESDISVINCTVTNNAAGEAHSGGGLELDYCYATLDNCVIRENTAGGGAGVECYDSSVVVTDCTIADNCDGGAVFHSGSTLMQNCSIIDNVGFRGGGVLSYHNDMHMIACIITGNAATSDGGGLYQYGDSLTLTNCVFARNAAGADGGAINSDNATPTISDCTITGNTADDRGGALSQSSNEGELTDSILWSNSAPTGPEISISGTNTVLNISHSDIQGGQSEVYIWSGAELVWLDGNIDTDPLFVRDPNDGGDGWGDDPNTPEDEGANDDYGDLRLQTGSPCIDAGDNTAVPADVGDLDGDGDVDERIPFDLDGNPRFVQDPFTDDTGVPDPPRYRHVVDMGAYEYQFCFGDLDGDDVVGLGDLAQLLGSYGEMSGISYYDGDLDGDGDVDLADLAELLGAYGDVCE